MSENRAEKGNGSKVHRKCGVHKNIKFTKIRNHNENCSGTKMLFRKISNSKGPLEIQLKNNSIEKGTSFKKSDSYLCEGAKNIRLGSEFKCMQISRKNSLVPV